jgi:IS30 family transposase
MGKTHDLAAIERDKIAYLLAQNYPITQIASSLGRAKSTVSEEIKRNSYLNPETNCFEYIPSHAHHLKQQRRAKASQRNPSSNYRAINYALFRLECGWSPELIYGRVQRDHPEDKRYWMCPEAIYQLIYSREYVKERLWENLTRKRKKRRKKNDRRVHKGHIPQRVSIHERPVVINEKCEFGHWEGDTVEGRGHRDSVHTEVERISRYYMVKKISSITSSVTAEAQLDMFSKLPTEARRSTTLDNGRENHHHYKLRELNMKTYFADPYSSWQRGSNEWHNGLLRRYFPKGTDFRKVDQQEIDDVVAEINNRPRKVLNFMTPFEVFNLLIRS